MITQNVDNLHQDAGVPADQVIELHGNASYATCLECGLRHELADLKALYQATGDLPAAARCGGIVKTATISFGQAMPHEPMARAEAETLACDLFLVLGSSLVVYPAAGFPLLAKQNGAKLAIVNREPTDQDDDRRPGAARRDRPGDERGRAGERILPRRLAPRTQPRSRGSHLIAVPPMPRRRSGLHPHRRASRTTKSAATSPARWNCRTT